MASNQGNTEDQPSTSRKRKILTLKTKVHIINKFENGEKISQISKNLNLPHSTVSSIIRDKKRILAASKNISVLNSSTIIRKRHGVIAQMECTLKTWCEQQAVQNIRLTRSDICTQAKSFFEALKKDYGEAAKDETFLASKGWYFRFKQRCEENRLTVEENQDYEIPDIKVKKETKTDKALKVRNMEVTIESSFSDNLKAVIEEGEYTPRTVFNVDEIGLYWKRMPKQSYLARHDPTTVVFNESKDRLTVLLGGNAAGDLKLKPMVIYRIENPRALHNKSKGGLPVIWKSNSKASMTASVFEDWFGHYFIPEVERYCYANNIPCKVLLVLDSALYHPPTTLVDFDNRVNVVFLPQGETNSIQPIYLEISNILKAIYTRRVFSHLIEASRQNGVVTVEELWKEFNILDAIRLIVDSYADISERDWKKSWHKLCPFFSKNGDSASESNTTSEIVEEIVNLALELDMKVDRKDVCELLDSHIKEPTIEELIEMQEYSVNEELDIQDPLLSEGAMTVDSLTEAFRHIKMGLQILENIDSNEQRARTTRLGVMKLMSAYEQILNEKVKLLAQAQDESLNMSSITN